MKTLVVNADLCDMRSVKEETLKSYESIVVNSDIVLMTSETKDLIARYPMVMNVDEMIELPSDETIHVQNVNGGMTIDGKTAAAAGKTLLHINGGLRLGADGLEAAKSYYKISVNGSVRMPRSFVGQMSHISVNGSVKPYPDGAILLKPTTVVDKLFVLRAKNTLYYAEKRLVFVDSMLDGNALAAKGATFESPNAVIAESLCESVVPILDEKADIKIVADGTVFVDGSTTLDDALVGRYGCKLYVNGNLTLNAESAATLTRIEKLYINGTVRLPASLKEAFLTVDAEYTNIEVIQEYSRVIKDMPYAKVDKKLLESCEKDLLVEDCAFVKIKEDVPADLILERLVIKDCASVRCSEEQEGVVAAISKDVASISHKDEGDFLGIGGMIKDALSGALNTKVVNADTYVM